MRNKITKKNMDLDLRRYGKMLYSKAEKSGENGDSSTEGNDRISLIDLLKEAVKFKIENGTVPLQASDEIVYPDTFIVDTGEEEYEEIPHSAASIFIFNYLSFVPAYNNPPIFSANKFYALYFDGSPVSFTDDVNVEKITTLDTAEYGGYPSKELYIFSDGGK